MFLQFQVVSVEPVNLLACLGGKRQDGAMMVFLSEKVNEGYWGNKMMEGSCYDGRDLNCDLVEHELTCS